MWLGESTSKKWCAIKRRTSKSSLVSKVTEISGLAIDNQEKLADITVALGKAQSDTNKIFEQPEQVDYEITNFNYDHIIKELRDRLQ